MVVNCAIKSNERLIMGVNVLDCNEVGFPVRPM